MKRAWAAVLTLSVVPLVWLAATTGAPPAPYSLRRVAVDPAGGGDATLSPDGTRFVTASRRSGNWELWTFDLATSRWTQVTAHPADDFEARWSPDGGRLAFTSTRSGHKNVWILDLARGTTRQLTFSPHDDEYPAWSPDGRSVVYTGGPWGSRDYFLVPAAGGMPQPLGRAPGRAGACTFDRDGESLVCHRYDLGSGDVIRLWRDGEIAPLTLGPAWDYKPAPSPDGRWVAFSRSEEGPSRIALVAAGGGRVQQLTRSPFDDRWPTWGGSGGRLLFHRVVERGRALKMLDRESGEVRTLVGAQEAPLQGALDRSGERLVYCAQQAGRKVLKLLDLRTGARRRLDTGPGEACFPRWSPGGEWIAFVGKSRERWEVSVVGPDGRGRRALTAGLSGLHGMDGPLDWSPDGSRLVFHADTEPFEADLYVLEVTSGQVVNLTRDPWFDEAPSWSPDGSRILFMSTRGGDWTWGLFALSLADGSLATLAGPDWDEKNFARMASDGTTVWSAYDADGVEHLVERCADGRLRRLQAAGVDARWPSYVAGGRSILFTAVERHVEYWLAENLLGLGSPLRAPEVRATAAPAAVAERGPEAARRRPALASARADGSPVSLHRR